MTDIAAFLAQENASLELLAPPMATAHWNLAMQGSEENSKALEALTIKMLEHFSQRGPYEMAKALRRIGSTDPLQARQLTLVELEYLQNQFAPEQLAAIADLETQLNTLFTNFRGTLAGQPISDNEAVRILQESTDSNLRKQAWEATKMVAGEAAPILKALIIERNKAAQALGYPDYWHLKMAAAEIDVEQLFSWWDRIAEESTASWNDLKRTLDARLAAKYGIAIEDLRPWHYEDPQFQKAPQNPAANLDTWYKPLDIDAVTRATFNGMGQGIDNLLAKSSLMPAEGKYQGAFCMNVDHQGDIRVCCNIVPNERWMATNLHEFGHAAYEKYVDPTLPHMLRTASHSITTEGIAIFMGNLANDPEWMSDFAGIDRAQVEAVLPVIREQKRLEDMIFTRYEQVMVRFERELYRDPEQNLNALWWDLVEQYQGLTRPEGRDWPDYASKVHFSVAPCMYQNYLIGYMFITQLASYLRREVTNGGPLASPEVGAYLRDAVYKPGASIRWDDLIKQATGEPLNPTHWLEYLSGTAVGATA